MSKKQNSTGKYKNRKK